MIRARRRLGSSLCALSLVALMAGWSGSAAALCAPATLPSVEETDFGVTDPGLHPAGDLDADGRGDVVQIGSTSLLDAVRGYDGTTIWASPDEVDTVYRAGDLDGVPGDDLIVRLSEVTSAGGGGQATLYEFRGVSGATGATLWTKTYPSLVNFGGARHEGSISVLSTPVDLDGDGARDLLLGQHFQEADTMVTRSLFESISGKTGATIARYGAGVGTWYPLPQINGPSRQLAFAVVVPDLTGDCLADVAVNASRLSLSAIQVFPGKGGAPVWHKEIAQEGTERVLAVTGAYLDNDATGDVLLSVGMYGHAPISGSEVELIALSGSDGAQVWSSVFPQNLSRLTLQPGADGSGHDILLSGPFARSYGNIGVVDGTTGAIRWQRYYIDGGTILPGDATGDGVDDLIIGLEKCVMGCVSTEAQLISASDGTVVWTREAHQGEDLVPIGADLDGDGLDDMFAFRDGEGQPSFYAAVSGRDGSLLWHSYRRMDDAISILRIDTLDIRPDHPGVDVLEGFRGEDHVSGPAARPGDGGTPFWYR
jgi:hypothetical protein